MPKNEFKAFAISDDANVLKQSEYESLPALVGGFQAGIARSEELNKVWRQASTIASVIASFMANASGKDVLDDGDLNKLQKTLLEALLNNSILQLDERYLNAKSNLKDLDKVEEARDNLGLGSAATKNVGIGVGNVLQQGAWGIGTSTQDSAAGSSHVSRFMFEPFQPGTLYPDSVCIIQSGGPTATEWGQIAIGYGANFRVFAGHGTYNSPPEITEFYHDKRKPTASDVGAYPINGGILDGNMSATGSVSSGPGKDISSGQDIWAGRDLYANRNASITGNIEVGGYIKSGVGSDVVSQRDIWASRNIYENGQRVYSPNNKPSTASLAVNGWEKDLATGVITQWGKGLYSDGQLVNFPIAFPNAAFAVTISSDPNDNLTLTEVSQAYPVSNSQFRAGCATFSGGNFVPSSLNCNWIAKGY
ncbi:gp53-like domain-containing protein [Cedecea sp. MMO-103]|uniref:gp53-like domain-containing protein n=1 Tax=Cedecea sp. MMO-103 TaxID=3081238 RepID=UPI003018977B